MRNLFINQYRKEKKRQEGKDAKVNYYEYFQGASINNAGELEINANEINQVIDELDDMYRIPFQMYFEGYKYEEIQKEMAPLPMGTIKSRIHIARKKLKERLAQLEIAER